MFLCNGEQISKTRCQTHFYFLRSRFSRTNLLYVSFFTTKVKKLDADDVNNKLREVFKFYLGDSIISRLRGHAKTCFEMLQTYLKFRATKCEPDKVMCVCCFRCLKFLVCYILIFDLYVLAFKKNN